jgi:hypothetical protein
VTEDGRKEESYVRMNVTWDYSGGIVRYVVISSYITAAFFELRVPA